MPTRGPIRCQCKEERHARSTHAHNPGECGNSRDIRLYLRGDEVMNLCAACRLPSDLYYQDAITRQREARP